QSTLLASASNPKSQFPPVPLFSETRAGIPHGKISYVLLDILRNAIPGIGLISYVAQVINSHSSGIKTSGNQISYIGEKSCSGLKLRFYIIRVSYVLHDLDL